MSKYEREEAIVAINTLVKQYGPELVRSKFAHLISALVEQPAERLPYSGTRIGFVTEGK